MSALPPKADMDQHGRNALCHVWTAPSWQGIFSRCRVSRVQPCVVRRKRTSNLFKALRVKHQQEGSAALAVEDHNSIARAFVAAFNAPDSRHAVHQLVDRAPPGSSAPSRVGSYEKNPVTLVAM